jgi:hypothetical protein
MKKVFWPIILLCLLLIPSLAKGVQIVQCNGPDCTIKSFFNTLVGIYNYLVFWIAIPLAGLSIAIGGIILMVSGGNPNLAGLGKKILYTSIIGLALAFCSYLIIDFLLKAIGFQGNWTNPF